MYYFVIQPIPSLGCEPSGILVESLLFYTVHPRDVKGTGHAGQGQRNYFFAGWDGTEIFGTEKKRGKMGQVGTKWDPVIFVLSY